MVSLAALACLIIASGGAFLLAGSGRSVGGYALMMLSSAPLLATLPITKAIFIWLALLGLAGFLVTFGLGLRRDGDPAAKPTS